MKKMTFALIAGASALAAVSALAGDDKKKGDHDWEAKLEAKFTEVDANGDGNVSGEEYLAYKQAEAEKEWTKWAEAAGDDGLVSLEEAKAHHEAKMAKKHSMKDHMGEEGHMDEEGEGDQ